MDWKQNLPPWKSQYSVLNRVDAMDCLSESLVNIIYMLTGFDGAPRALAKLANTQPWGNYEMNVLGAANNFGLIPYPLWQTPEDFFWKDYYAEIPKEILNQAIRLQVTTKLPDLTKSPLWTILRFPNGAQHGVAQINDTEYFDSEEGSEVKLLTYGGATIVSQLSLDVKIMIDCKTVKFADNRTFGIMVNTPNGTQIIKATDEDQWRSWHDPDSYGKPTVNNDGTTNWEAELTLNF